MGTGFSSVAHLALAQAAPCRHWPAAPQEGSPAVGRDRGRLPLPCRGIGWKRKSSVRSALGPYNVGKQEREQEKKKQERKRGKIVLKTW